MKNKNVMWVGLSAKKLTNTINLPPLAISTNTGKLISEIEVSCDGVNFYKTNLVKFPPLDFKGKLRYPTFDECEQCYPELITEINANDPNIIFLLGNKTATFVLRKLGFKKAKISYDYQVFKFEGRYYVPIYHPSYIMIYKRKQKDLYVEEIEALIKRFVL